jgi:hypothetical protein
MHDKPQTSTPPPDLGDVVAFSALAKKYPNIFLKPGTAAWLLRNRHRNGLASRVHFVGRTAMISVADFGAWLRSRPASPQQVERAASAKGT